MTNYIEQLMKEAGVGYIIECKHGDEFPENCDCNYPCEECSACIKKYPAFTLEKQLKLIKLLGNRKGYGSLGEQIDYFTEMEGLKFDKSVAQITSNAISSKILDKSVVKRILEDE